MRNVPLPLLWIQGKVPNHVLDKDLGSGGLGGFRFSVFRRSIR